MTIRRLAVALVSVGVLGCGFSARAEILSPQARLRKMSLQLRGITPTDAEYTQLAMLDSSAQASFFRAKANSYVMSDLAADKLSDRLFEVLRFDLPQDSLFLRDVTYRNAAQTGVDLALGFDRSMNSLKQAITRQISAGKSWDEILTSSDILFLPMAGQALSEFSQLSGELRAKFSELKAQGVPVTSVEEKIAALKMLSGELSLPAGVKVEAAVNLARADDFPRAVTYGKRLLQVLRNWIPLNPDLDVQEFDDALKSLQRELGDDPGLVKYLGDDGAYYVDDLVEYLSDTENGSKISKAEIEKTKCLVDGLFSARNQERRYPDVKCEQLNFASPLLSREVVAWLLQLDLSQAPQTTAAIDYLVKSAKSPRALEALLAGTDPKEIFSVPSIVSTQEFRDRYKKTRYSRAAAFFRTYFCDDMQPVITIDNSTKTAQALMGLKTIKFDTPADARAHEEVMRMITPDLTPGAMKPETSVTANQIAENSSGTAHFKPECVACHRKLDPAQILIAGKADFNSMPIEVVYDDSEGKEVRVPIKDFSELTQIVVKQERYVRCQSERMWAWTVGEDVSLNGNRRAELTKLYTESGANARQVIETLVNRPEFANDDSFTQAPTFSTVSGLLNRCNSCHAKEEDVPSFTTIPIDGEDHVRWLGKIAKSVQLGNKGLNAKMPKKGANWSLSEDDRVALGRWIWNGARNDDGAETITEVDRTKILKGASDEFMSAISAPRAATATFRSTWRRYMENFDLLNVLAQKFPETYAKCGTKVEMNMRGALGFKDKNSGVPTSLTPGIAMVDWLNKCFYSVAQAEVASVVEAGAASEGESFLTDERAIKLGLDVLKKAYGKDYVASWSVIDAELKSKVVSRLVDSLIGVAVLPAEDRQDLETTVKETIEDIATEKGESYTTTAALVDATFTILNDERFLTY